MYQCPWFGIFGPSFSNLPQFPKYTKTGITRPSDGLYPWVRLHLIWSVEFNTLDDLGYLWQISLTCPNLWIHKNKYILTLRWILDKYGFIWCEMWSLTIWMTFCISVSMIWGIWVQFLQLVPVPQIYQNRYNLTHRWSLHLSKASFDVKLEI